MNDPADPLVGATFGQISIEWKDSEGAEISRTFGSTWNFQLSASRWEKFVVDADAPENAVKATAVITLFSQDSKGMGSFYVDDCELTDRAKE
ncbi:MAG: hypothetical protein BWK77_04435 [Verrucomicrobia bacterium A1]|nr:MAG: hypothetical protein BWK77_04435 [Verrucomicrobia bacterium A1]